MSISEEVITQLTNYYRTVNLTGEQKDRLIEKYWEANADDRRIIATVYASLFAKDGAFVQRLVYYHDTKISEGGGGGGGGGGGVNGRNGGATNTSSSTGEDGVSSVAPKRIACKPTTLGSPTGRTPQFTHAQLLLRTAIHDIFPKLQGKGPFPIEFGVVTSEEERKEVIALYSTQFQYPDPPELHRLVCLPRSHSTRTRRRANGSYTFYIRSLSDDSRDDSEDCFPGAPGGAKGYSLVRKSRVGNEKQGEDADDEDCNASVFSSHRGETSSSSQSGSSDSGAEDEERVGKESAARTNSSRSAAGTGSGPIKRQRATDRSWRQMNGIDGVQNRTRGEVACAVTLTVHNYETNQFAELPLFATGVGYKKYGLGRLLNAAVMEWCRENMCEFIMVSADISAIPFWERCGYTLMTRQEKNRIAFYYQNDCFKFSGVEALIGYVQPQHHNQPKLKKKRETAIIKEEEESKRNTAPPLHTTGASDLDDLTEVAMALRKMPKFVVQGSITLPTP